MDVGQLKNVCLLSVCLSFVCLLSVFCLFVYHPQLLFELLAWLDFLLQKLKKLSIYFKI
jgi:hypothetical protein